MSIHHSTRQVVYTVVSRVIVLLLLMLPCSIDVAVLCRLIAVDLHV